MKNGQARSGPGDGAANVHSAGEAVVCIDLFRKARDGDHEALNRLLEQSVAPFHEWILRRVSPSARSGVEPSQLVMESLLQTVRHEPRFHPRTDGELQTHLRQDLQKRIADAGRSLRQRDDGDTPEDAVGQDGGSLLETTLGASVLDSYERALMRLDTSEREAIVARVELRQEWERVADSLGRISVEEARSITTGAVRKLAEEMCGEHHQSRRVEDLALAVAERSPVSWRDELRGASDGGERAIVEQLRVVAGVLDAHWSSSSLPRRLGDFEIVGEIGRGGMGVVYEARQISLDRRVALKVLPREMIDSPLRLERFEREAKALASLNHPNIVTIHSVEQFEGTRYITMELVDGDTLTGLIPDTGLPIQRLLDLAFPLADALSSAHEGGITHRDLKPANVMVNEEGRVKILDFGLAKLRDEAVAIDPSTTGTRDLALTQEGALLGTLPFMSPEQVRGESVDHRSDLFSMGSMLYLMSTGRLPFGGSTASEMRSTILGDTPAPVTLHRPDLPSDLERIIIHCLRKSPESRYQTAKGLRNELEELRLGLRSAEVRPRQEPVDPVPAPQPWWRMWRVGLPVALVVLVLVAALVVPAVRDRFFSAPASEDRYLAVLPFKALDGEQHGSALCAGLSEVLTVKLTQLTNAHGFQVAPSEQTRGSPPPNVEQLGQDLGINLAVTGSLQRHGDDVRVTVNLIDVRDRRQIGAEVIEAGIDDPFGLQDRIVETAVRLLQLELPPDERDALLLHGTDVAEAYELYLRGRGYLADYDDPQNVERAIAAFEQAIVLDSGYAQAHAGLGLAFWHTFEHTQVSSWVDRASATCTRSVELDSQQADGHLCLGSVMLGTGRNVEATAEFGRAASLDPTRDEAFRNLAYAYQLQGELEAAEETYLEAVRLRPRYWATHNWLGAFYAGRGRFDEALNSFRRVVELVPEGYRGYQNLGGVYLLLGRFDEATPVLERSVSLKSSAHGYSNLASAYFGRRQFDRAVDYNRRAIDLGSRDYAVWGNLGEAYYWADGQRDRSREAYERAVELAHEQLQINAEDYYAMGELAKYYAMLGDESQATEYLERALVINPEDPDLRLNAAIIHAKLGHTDDARSWLEKSRQAGITEGWITANPIFDDLG